MGDERDGKTKEAARSYPTADMKMLFARSAGRCGFPDCKRVCVQPGTVADRPKVIGKIAHIVAHSDGGPRNDPTMPMELRDRYENWILLCPTCHDVVDGQFNSYTVHTLRQWKTAIEKWVDESLASNMPMVTFVELETVCNALMAPAPDGDADLQIIPIGEKIRRNSLTLAVHRQLAMGTGMARLIEAFVNDMARLDSEYPERLRSGFVSKYHELRATGVTGDGLFYLMLDFATLNTGDMKRFSAGLAVLAYFFAACDVFEK